MDKVKIFKVNKKLAYSILIISIVGIIAGALFLNILKDTDKDSVMLSLENFMNNVVNNNLNYSLSLKTGLITNIIFVLAIWLFGISIVGIPVILFLYFIKTFSLGFTLSSILFKYKAKGLIYALVYIFPHNILNIFIFSILSIHSIIYSFKISDSFFKKENIDFKPIINKHKYILLISILGVIITSLYNTYIMPYLLKIVLNFTK